MIIVTSEQCRDIAYSRSLIGCVLFQRSAKPGSLALLAQPTKRGGLMSEQLQSIACGNILLSRLPVHERNAAERCFETGSFVAGDLLMRANRPSDYVFFPLDSVISLVRTLDDGSTIELGLVGNEGMIGIDVFLEGGIQRSDAIGQSAGSVYCLSSA